MGQFNEPSHDCYVIIVTWLDIPSELNELFILLTVPSSHPLIYMVFNALQL